jgi:2-oxoglutarate ferredoxin oxidoreductase subunit alpha
LHAHQDEFPRIILTPGDPKETFHMVMKAFNLADKYQTPVVVLIDKNICENDQTFDMFDNSGYEINRGKLVWEKADDYERYALSKDGISARSVPGSGNFFVANSDEHDKQGFSSEEIDNRYEQMDKRMKKLVTCEKEDMQEPILYGPKNADLTLISWGSNKGVILQAMKEFENVNFLHLTWINPLPANKISEILEGAKRVVNIECNYAAILNGIIREKVGFEIEDNLLKYDGRPFYVQEITGKIEEVLGNPAKKEKKKSKGGKK